MDYPLHSPVPGKNILALFNDSMPGSMGDPPILDDKNHQNNTQWIVSGMS